MLKNRLRESEIGSTGSVSGPARVDSFRDKKEKKDKDKRTKKEVSIHIAHCVKLDGVICADCRSDHLAARLRRPTPRLLPLQAVHVR